MFDQRASDHPGSAGRDSAGPAAATAPPWPPRLGLHDPRHDPRCWGDSGPAAHRHAATALDEDGVRLTVVRGRHVSLRTFTRADLPVLDQWSADPAVDYLVGSELLHAYRTTYRGSPWFYDACLGDPTQIVLMIEPDEGCPGPVGLARLFDIHVPEGYAGLEIIVPDRRAQRRGFGVQAGRLAAIYAIEVLGLRRLESRVYAYNRPSINSLLRNGFKQEGVLRKAAYKDGRYWDLLIFGILGEEMQAERERNRGDRPGDGNGAPA